MESRAPLSIHMGSFLLWIFAVALFHLGGVYLGGIFTFLRFIVLLLPVLSMLYMIAVFSGLRLNQYFSTEHPQKYATVDYRFVLGNEGRLPSVPILLSFVVGGYSLAHLHTRCCVDSQSKYEFTHTVTCPYRGIYTVGTMEIRLIDPLGIVTMYVPVWHRTFYVYPRILPLTAALQRITSSARSAHIPEGIVTDVTLLRGVKEYQYGMEMRHMAWKKFAQYGYPMIREYDSSSSQGVNIVIDTRPTADIEIEDVSLESALSLAGRCLELGVPTVLLADGMPSTAVQSHKDLDFFKKRSIGLFFHSMRSPMEAPDLPTGAVILISHVMDRETLRVLEPAHRRGADIRLIANICQVAKTQAAALKELRRREGWGNRMALIRRSENLDAEIATW